MAGEIVQFALLTLFVVAVLSRLRKRQSVASEPVTPAARDRQGPRRLYVLANQLYRHFEASAQPADVLQYEDFEAGVTLLNNASEGYTTQDLLAYYKGDNAIIACMALEALSRRRNVPDIRDEILSVISTVALWVRYFALRALAAHTPAHRPLVGAILLRADPSWMNRLGLQLLRESVTARLDAGEKPEFGDGLQGIAEEQGAFLRRLLDELGEPRLQPLAAALDHWQRTRIDTRFLASIGRVWAFPPDAEEAAVIAHDALRYQAHGIEATLTQGETRRSILLVGEAGVGKTAIVRVLGVRLQGAGWVIFEASGSELVAGQIYIGALEERLRNLLRQLGGKQRVLWYIPEFHSLFWAGRHTHSETSALDFLLPHIESGALLVLGETQPAAYERLALLKPRCMAALEPWRIEPLPEAAALELAREWGRRHTRPGLPELLPEPTLREAWQLAQQYLGDQAAPGNLLKFLDLTRKRLAVGMQAGGGADESAGAEREASAAEASGIGSSAGSSVAATGPAATPAPGAATPGVIRVDDLIVTLSQLTGLPESILDERHSLNLDALRQLFEKRVLGQPEAVDCLVERVAMIKAGVTDPTRPLGVFLFAGPTGTGKTEIAKTLAEFLFGSPNRMIRIDMSELKTPESLQRLVGSPESRADGALVDQIRKQPFSVVLLDEFEKAHPNIWDLFLQVFDDGRLTDRTGNTADFRHAIIIMTSNLGGVMPSGASLGFAREGDRFRPQDVERAIAQAFHREFLNRIDRVVVFKPLARDTMREILHKELDAATRRRGLRTRAWAIEWDDEAIEFLLAKGFTTDLGARPLKRAIERYVLAPLALTIVNHQFPEGDQFLFVKAENDQLVVEFVDPGAGGESSVVVPVAEEAAAAVEPGIAIRPERIAFGPHGTAAEIDSLRRGYERLRECVEAESWQDNKRNLLAMTGGPGFWRSPDRFRVLGEAEYLDRIERGVRGAGSLLERLLGSRPGTRGTYPRDLVGRLAEQLYLLEMACSGVRERAPREAFVLVEAGRDVDVDPAATNRFALRLGTMYRTWAKKRRMQLEVVEESAGETGRPYRVVFAVSGYGAYTILRLEAGLHVLEIPGADGRPLRRCKVRVRVASQPDQPAGADAGALRRQAAEAFRATPGARLLVVRRYRESPPLVRDRVRGWRSGKLDRILDGDFDLMVPVQTQS